MKCQSGDFALCIAGIACALFAVGCPSGNNHDDDNTDEANKAIQGTWNGYVWESGAPNSSITPYSDQYVFDGSNFTGTAFGHAFGDNAVQINGSFSLDATANPKEITLNLQTVSTPYWDSQGITPPAHFQPGAVWNGFYTIENGELALTFVSEETLDTGVGPVFVGSHPAKALDDMAGPLAPREFRTFLGAP